MNKNNISRTHRRLSVLPEVNEDSEVFSPTQERELKKAKLESCVRLSRTNTEQSSASLDSYLAQNTVTVKQRQLSDSWILNNKGTASPQTLPGKVFI